MARNNNASLSLKVLRRYEVKCPAPTSLTAAAERRRRAARSMNSAIVEEKIKRHLNFNVLPPAHYCLSLTSAVEGGGADSQSHTCFLAAGEGSAGTFYFFSASLPGSQRVQADICRR